MGDESTPSGDRTLVALAKPAKIEVAQTLPSGAGHPRPRTASPKLKRGDSLGRYVVIGTLGSGGMGVVYSAYDPELDRKLAVKLLLPGDRSGQDHSVRLLREAQALAKLNHPNVVAVHDVGTLDGRVYVAMEFIDGHTAEDWQALETRSWRQVLEVYFAAGEGLAAAHAKDLVHRDFKPTNIMVGTDDRVRVMDFGLARSGETPSSGDVEAEAAEDASASTKSGPLSSSITRAGAIMGTPAYMAPEQFVGETADARADQFSYCVSLWESLYGRRPFEGDSMHNLAVSVTTGNVRDPGPTDVPRRIRRVLERGLRKVRAERWPDMGALLRELRRDPTRARRRVWLAAGAAGVAGAVFGGRALIEYRAEQACASQAAVIEDVWTDATAQRMQQAFEADQSPYASRMFTNTRHALDEYATRWRDRSMQACLAGRGSDSAPVAEAVLCLDDSRDAFEDLVEILGSPSRGAIIHSLRATTRLPEPSQCLDGTTAAAQARLRADADPERVRQIQRQIHRAMSLTWTEDLDAAMTAATAADEAARELGNEWVMARAGFCLGGVLNEHSRYEPALNAYSDAYFAASRVGADGLAAEAAAAAAYVSGSALNRADQGLTWVRLAETANVRAGDVSPMVEAAHLAKTASAYRIAGELDEARSRLERALQIKRELWGPEHPEVAHLLNSLGTVMGSAGKPDAARELYEQAKRIFEQSQGPEHPDVSMVLINLANSRRDGRNLRETEPLIRRALEIDRAAYGEADLTVARDLNVLGALHKRLGDYDDAKTEFAAARRILDEIGADQSPEMANIMANLASLHRIQGDPETAVRLLRRSLAIDQARLGRESTRHLPKMVNLANALMTAERFDELDPLLARAEAMVANLSEGHFLQIAVWQASGISYQIRNDDDKAAAKFEQVLRTYESGKAKLSTQIARAAANLAQLEYGRGRHAQALRRFEQAEAMFTELFSPEHFEVARVIGWLAELHEATGEADKAETGFRRALEGLEDRDETYPGETARVEFGLARMLWGDPSRRAEARRLARSARDHYASAGDGARADLARANAWLTARGIR